MHFLRNGDEGTLSKEAFKEIIHLLQVVPDYDIDNNGRGVIDVLRSRCTIKTDALKAQYPDIDIENEKAYFHSLGVTSHNIYLFVRGHNLFDLIVEIGNHVNNKLLTLEKVRLAGDGLAINLLYKRTTPFKRELEMEIVFEGYEEIERVGREISTIFT